MKPTILLTGGSGQLGQMLINGLKNDYDVFNFDINSEESSGHYIKVDLSNFAKLKSAFAILPPVSAIVHFGADPYPFASWELVSKHNIEGTQNIYECARLFKVPKVVFASSAHVIGNYEGYPQEIKGKKILTTDDPVRPDGFYGLSKAVGELIGRTYFDLYKISSINLRIGHTTGNTTLDPNLDKVELYEEDLIDLVKKSLETKVGYGVYFAVSDNKGRFLDLTNASEELGYKPTPRT